MSDSGSRATRTDERQAVVVRRTLVTLLVSAALGLVGQAVAQGGGGSEPSTPAPPAEAESGKAAEATKPEATAPPARSKESRDSFEPPDRIRVDSAVSFPVDI